ncbi:MAG: helicase-related protein [Candidatus Aminicenantes bacterium]|nr:helicase-related protein [Candidatus Aminicenantes bacterium]
MVRREGAGGRHRQERRKYLRFQILREVTLTARQALGLEPWGRMKVNYEGLEASLPWIQERAHALAISPERLRDGIASVLDHLRRRGALYDPEHEIFTKYWREGDREIQQGYLPGFLRPVGTKLRRGATEKKALVTQWLSDRGDTTMRQVAAKWGVVREDVEPVLESLFDFLVRRRLLVPVRLKGSRGRPLPNLQGVYQVNSDRLRLSPNRGVKRCRNCRRKTTRDVPYDRCPAWRCRGLLEWVPEDADNYDLQLLDGAYSMLRPEEHTAMVPQVERERLENLFKGASDAVNCLVCTPTLELGIDIGQLDSVLMRNVPPLPANYWQRAGRAGRHHRMAVDITYCRSVSHDLAYFGEPLKLVGRPDRSAGLQPPQRDHGRQACSCHGHYRAAPVRPRTWTDGRRAGGDPGGPRVLPAAGRGVLPVRRRRGAKRTVRLHGAARPGAAEFPGPDQGCGTGLPARLAADGHRRHGRGRSPAPRRRVRR